MTLSHPTRLFAWLLLALPVGLAALISGVVGISAAGPTKLSLTPVGVTGVNFVITLQPGESRDLAVQLSNHGAESVRARTFAADAYSMINGGFAVRLDGESTHGTTSWLSYATDDVELASGAAIERDFTVAVPAVAQPGEYLTSVVVQNADPTSNDEFGQNGMVLKQIIRQVVAVSIDVPGPRTPALELGPVTHRIVADRSTLAVGVHNLGNVRLTPAGEFLLWDSTGAEITRSAITMDTVYAHTDTYVEVPFSEWLEPGEYTAELMLSDAGGASATSGKLPLIISNAVADTTPQSFDGVPSLAQTSPSRVVPVAWPSPLMLAMIAFGAGVGLMLTVLGVGFVIYQRRSRRDV